MSKHIGVETEAGPRTVGGRLSVAPHLGVAAGLGVETNPAAVSQGPLFRVGVELTGLAAVLVLVSRPSAGVEVRA